MSQAEMSKKTTSIGNRNVEIWLNTTRGSVFSLTWNLYDAIFIGMKIRFLKDITVDVEKPRLNEVWDKQYHRWDEISVEQIFTEKKRATLQTTEGDFIVAVPTDSFEVLKEKRSSVTFEKC